MYCHEVLYHTGQAGIKSGQDCLEDSWTHLDDSTGRWPQDGSSTWLAVQPPAQLVKKRHSQSNKHKDPKCSRANHTSPFEMEFKILSFNIIQPSRKKKVVSSPPLMLLAVIVFDFVLSQSLASLSLCPYFRPLTACRLFTHAWSHYTYCQHSYYLTPTG